MKAVVYQQSLQMPQIAEVAEPVCPSDGVVVAVRATGLCRSDWHAWMGHEPVPLPHVPGHEFAGVIDQSALTSMDGRLAIALRLRSSTHAGRAFNVWQLTSRYATGRNSRGSADGARSRSGLW